MCVAQNDIALFLVSLVVLFRLFASLGGIGVDPISRILHAHDIETKLFLDPSHQAYRLTDILTIRMEVDQQLVRQTFQVQARDKVVGVLLRIARLLDIVIKSYFWTEIAYRLTIISIVADGCLKRDRLVELVLFVHLLAYNTVLTRDHLLKIIIRILSFLNLH